MKWWSLIIGIVLYGCVMFDIFKTTLSLHGGGPISKGILVAISRVAYFYRRVSGGAVKYLGLLLILTLLFSWFLLQLVGLTFILYTDPMAVIHSSSRLPADFWERIYFAGTAITTVGFGDWIAGTGGWQLFTILIAGSGLISISMAISYLVPVLQATIQKRRTSNYLSTLGGSPEDLLRRGWNGQDFSPLGSHFTNLTTMMLQHSLQHRAYPIIHYTHGEDRMDSFSVNLAALDETLTILLVNVPQEYQMHHSSLHALRNAVTKYLETLSGAFIEPAEEEPPPTEVAFLRELGISPVMPADDMPDHPDLRSLRLRRRLLRALVETEGNTWADIHESHRYNDELDLDFERVQELKNGLRPQRSLFNGR